MIRIDRGVHDALLAHARADAPLEACGYLGGRRLADGGLHISRYLPLTNADHAREHFSFLPAEQFVAVKTLRQDGLQALGLWHSHPVSPARPSPEDIRLAYDPAMLWFISSLLPDGGAAYNGRPGVGLPWLRVWNIAKDQVTEIGLTIVEADGAETPVGILPARATQPTNEVGA